MIGSSIPFDIVWCGNCLHVYYNECKECSAPKQFSDYWISQSGSLSFPSFAVLYEPANPSGVVELKEILPAAHGIGLTVRSWELREADGFNKVFCRAEQGACGWTLRARGPAHA